MGVRGADGPDATGEEQAEGGACSEEELWGLGGGLWKRRRCSERGPGGGGPGGAAAGRGSEVDPGEGAGRRRILKEERRGGA